MKIEIGDVVYEPKFDMLMIVKSIHWPFINCQCITVTLKTNEIFYYCDLFHPKYLTLISKGDFK